jgi:DinB superfamily
LRDYRLFYCFGDRLFSGRKGKGVEVICQFDYQRFSGCGKYGFICGFRPVGLILEQCFDKRIILFYFYIMKEIIQELKKIIDDYTGQLQRIPGDELEEKINPAKWSRKEIIGHLIDSAQNNIRRFVVAQHELNPHIVYAQDSWVAAANYQHYPTKDLIELWALLNKHLCIVLENLPAAMEERQCLTSELHSIEWLAADYNKHLLHHLHNMLQLEPVAYP